MKWLDQVDYKDFHNFSFTVRFVAVVILMLGMICMWFKSMVSYKLSGMNIANLALGMDVSGVSSLQKVSGFILTSLVLVQSSSVVQHEFHASSCKLMHELE